MGHCAPTKNDGTIYYLDAYNFNPHRREPLHALLRNYRLSGKYTACRMFGATAISIPYPSNDPLAYGVELAVYEWATPEELAGCLYELGEKKTAYELLERVVNTTHLLTLTASDTERIRGSIKTIKATM
jgi:hypothetical protein